MRDLSNLPDGYYESQAFLDQVARDDDVADGAIQDLKDRADEEDCDRLDCAYSLFVFLIHILTQNGYDTKMLVSDVEAHSDYNKHLH